MKLSKYLLAFLASAFVVFGFSASAESNDQSVQSAEEVEALLQQLGLVDMDQVYAEERAVIGDSEPIELLHRGRRGHHHRRPPHRRPPRRRPPVRRPPRRRPPAYGHTVCWVENGRGQMFRGRGYSPRVARERAARKCYSVSRYCYRAGCRHY